MGGDGAHGALELLLEAHNLSAILLRLRVHGLSESEGSCGSIIESSNTCPASGPGLQKQKIGPEEQAWRAVFG
jgi:hypothetical protein